MFIMKHQVEFHFGKKKRTIWDWVKLSVAVEATLWVAELLPGVSRKGAFNLIDEMQLKGDHDFLNEFVIRDPELLSYRVERTLDKALKEYND